MSIRIGNNSEYFELVDVMTEAEGRGYATVNPEFLFATLKLHMSGVSTNIRATFMRGELTQLLDDLQKLYDTLKYEFTFANLEDNIKLRVTPTSNGHIEVGGYLRTEDYQTKVSFELTTDQTFLPSTISQLKEALEQLGGKV